MHISMLEEYYSKIVCLPLHGHGLPVPGRNRLFICFYKVEQISGKLFDPFWAPRVPLFPDSFMVVVVRILVFGHFGLKSKPLWLWNLTQNPWDYKTRAQELINGAICKLLSFFVRIWEHFKDGRVWGFFLPHEFGGQFWRFLQFLIYLPFGWTNFDEIGDQFEEFLMF